MQVFFHLENWINEKKNEVDQPWRRFKRFVNFQFTHWGFPSVFFFCWFVWFNWKVPTKIALDIKKEGKAKDILPQHSIWNYFKLNTTSKDEYLFQFFIANNFPKVFPFNSCYHLLNFLNEPKIHCPKIIHNFSKFNLLKWFLQF